MSNTTQNKEISFPRRAASPLPSALFFPAVLLYHEFDTGKLVHTLGYFFTTEAF